MQSASPKYALFKDTLSDGLKKVGKYYSKLDEKPCFILALSKPFFQLFYIYTYLFHTVLHPYYKLAYIKLAWGGPDEQEEERRKGNPYAKDWQDKARKIIEKTVSFFVTKISNGRMNPF